MNHPQSMSANPLSPYQWHPESLSEAVHELWMLKEHLLYTLYFSTSLLTLLKEEPVADPTKASVRL
jgi:hypothetical protein